MMITFSKFIVTIVKDVQIRSAYKTIAKKKRYIQKFYPINALKYVLALKCIIKFLFTFYFI